MPSDQLRIAAIVQSFFENLNPNYKMRFTFDWKGREMLVGIIHKDQGHTFIVRRILGSGLTEQSIYAKMWIALEQMNRNHVEVLGSPIAGTPWACQ